MMVYLSLKTLHLIAVFAFITGLLIQSHILKLYRTMPLPHMPDERRLLSRIQHWDLMVTVPALTLTWIFGLSAALHGGWFPSGWLKIKLIVVSRPVHVSWIAVRRATSTFRFCANRQGSLWTPTALDLPPRRVCRWTRSLQTLVVGRNLGYVQLQLRACLGMP